MKKIFTLLLLVPLMLACAHDDDPGGGPTPPEVSETDNLVLLCKVWGFAKYYHPVFSEDSADAGADADAELVRLIPQVRDADWKGVRELLAGWIDELGPFESSESFWDDYIASYASYGMERKVLSDLGWTGDASYLGAELSGKLTALRHAVRESPSKYAYDFSAGVYDEEPYAAMGDPAVEYRLLGLFRYWNVIEYFFPAKYLTDTPWDRVLPEHIPEFIEAEGMLPYRKAVARLVSELCDSHAENDIIPLFGNRIVSGFSLTAIDGKAVVGWARPAVIGRSIKRGDEVVSIDGVTLGDVKAKYEEYFSTSNKDYMEYRACIFMCTSDKPSVEVKFISKGVQKTETYETTVYRSDAPPAGFPAPPVTRAGSDFHSVAFDGQVGYFVPGAYTPPATQMFEDFKGTKGIIIDMRYYPKTDITDFPYRYFDNTSRPFVKAIENDPFMPGSAAAFFLTTGDYADNVNEGTYGGKVVLLVDAGTVSNGEWTTMEFQTLPNVTVIGSQTAGADGNVVYLDLPGGIRTAYSGIGVQYPDGTETQRAGVRIDREVRPTVEGLKAGRDELVDAAVEIILGE